MFRQPVKCRNILNNQELWNVLAMGCGKSYVNKAIHRFKGKKLLINLWIMWISGGKYNNIRVKKVDKIVYLFFYPLWINGFYFFNSSSPTVTISPAPMVMTRSPGLQFSSKKFSISLKVEK